MRVPVATYRLQLNEHLRFEDARALVPYLHALGVTDVYLSPIFKARAHSPHGYDVVDPTVLNTELGTERDLDDLASECRRHGMGILLDIVPNHMGVDADNAWWTDVLENGPDSPHAAVFDIDWREGKVVLPVLGAPYGTVLENGELTVSDGVLHYFDRTFPIRGIVEPGINGEKGDPRSFDRLHALLEEQCYRLAFWRTAVPNYRRFFDINDLVGVRVEDPGVFAATHALALRLVREGSVTGLRVDHVDGLRDPGAYLARLADAAKTYVIVEKILTGEEQLPAWPVAGTTGYDWLKVANGIFAAPEGVAALDKLYRTFTGSDASFQEIVFEQKQRVLRELFPGELAALVQGLGALARRDRHARDIPTAELDRALALVTASLPVYRTYVSQGALAPGSQPILEQALASARIRSSDLAPAIDFVGRAVRLEVDGALDFVLRWQQLTGPVMAKGLEDTAFYIYTRLLSLNDIGARRSRARSTGDFHRFNAARQERWPHTLNATSTHDTKRCEDVRARINVLSELTSEWAQCVPRWSRFNRAKRRALGKLRVPDASEELLVYQTLVGAWPLVEAEVPGFRERLQAYLVKAAREAKVHTTWTRPDLAYEEALVAFAAAILEPSRENRFLPDFLRFQKRVAFFGAWNALAQVLLKIGSPGVPDFYQGTELWNLSLVDPDNRRPVDWGERARLLGAMTYDFPELLEHWGDGRIKLFVTSRGLAFRRENAALFREGGYTPLQASPGWRDHVCAFARHLEGSWAIVAVPRLLVKVTLEGVPPVGPEVWPTGTLDLPAGAPQRFVNVLTGETIERPLRLSEVFGRMPVALLHGPA